MSDQVEICHIVEVDVHDMVAVVRNGEPREVTGRIEERSTSNPPRIQLSFADGTQTEYVSTDHPVWLHMD